MTALIYAVAVICLLSYDPCIGAVDNRGRSPLHLAVQNRQVSTLEILLGHCGKLSLFVDCYDCSGRTPLHTAIDLDFEQGVSLFLKSGAKVHYLAGK